MYTGVLGVAGRCGCRILLVLALLLVWPGAAPPPGGALVPAPRRAEASLRAGVAGGLVAPGPEARVALAEVNAARAALGLAPLTHSAALAAAAASHARYLAANPEVAVTDPHREVPGTPGFTGADPLDRAGYAGFRGDGAAEVIAHEEAAEEAVWNWLATPYHRAPLIDARAAEAGFAVARAGADWHQVLDVSVRPAPAPGLLVFPADGMTGVPVAWPGLESPDPLRFFPGAAGPLGFTASLTFPGRVRALRLDTARLSGPDGEVPVYLLTPDRDEYLRSAIALLPRAPLAPAATYTVELAGQADWGAGLQPFARRWSFTTRPEVPEVRRAVLGGVGGVIQEVRLEGRGFSSATRAYIAGVPVAVAAAGDTRARLVLPPGLPPGPADLVLAGPGGEMVWPRFLTGSEALPGGDGVLQAWTLAAGEQVADVPALVAAGSGAEAALVPADALAPLGLGLERDPGTGRWLLRLGARWAVAGPPRLAAWVGEEGAPHLGRRVELPRPPVERDGRLYVPGALLAHLGASVWLDAPARTVTVAPPGTLFPDALRHWARPALLALARLGVVSGYPDGSFRPDQPLTRAALVRLAVAARGLAPRPGPAGALPGTAGHWLTAQGWLQAAVAAGLVLPEEHPDGFAPDQHASRLEAVVLAIRALGLEAEARRRAGATPVGLVDGAAVPARYRGHVQIALEAGLVAGYPEAGGGLSFRPGRPVTRAEAAAFILRVRRAMGE